MATAKSTKRQLAGVANRLTGDSATAKSTKRQLAGVANRLTGDSAPLPNLPEEIITEILLRLPVKSLLKFRCVSKSWLSLICSPQFKKHHLMISTNNNTGFHNRLVFGSGYQRSVFYIFDLYPKKNENSCVDSLVFDSPLDGAIQIVGSCNGLVCMALANCGVVLWNPATRKSKKLSIFYGNLITTEYGFGYDALNDDYKVFIFSWISRGDDDEQYDETQMKVYSSRADSWRIVEWPNGTIYDGPGVFLNGSIHWKVYRDDNPSNCDVIAQNVTTETCSNMELPKVVNVGDDGRVMVGVSGGSLCVSYDYISYMDVWVMKKYGVEESWTKLVCLPYFFCRRHSDHVRPKVLFISENGGVILSLGSDLIMYKPSEYHEVYSLGDCIEVEASTYSESLLSPDFDNLEWI